MAKTAEQDLIGPLDVYLPASERVRAGYQLRRSVRVAQELGGVRKVSEEADKFIGINTGQHACMDPRNNVILKEGLLRPVTKKGGAVGSSRGIVLEPRVPVPPNIDYSRDAQDRRVIEVPQAEFLSKLLRDSVYDPRKRQHLQIISHHTGTPPCGFMHGIEQAMIHAGQEDPYQGDSLSHNIDLNRIKTAGPITNAYNLFRSFRDLSTLKRVATILPWETDRGTFILNHDFKNPERRVTVLDLALKHGGIFEEEFGPAGQFAEKISDIRQLTPFWSQRIEMMKQVASGKRFSTFQDDIYAWMDNSPECDGLTDEQAFGLMTVIADNAAMVHLLDSGKRKTKVLSEFRAFDMYVSPVGTTLNMYDPNASRLSATPHNTNESLPQFVKSMFDLSKEKESMVAGLNGHLTGRYYAIPGSRIAYICVGANPDVRESRVAGLTDLERSMRALQEDPEIESLRSQGELYLLPVLVDSSTGAAIEVPVLLDYYNQFYKSHGQRFRHN